MQLEHRDAHILITRRISGGQQTSSGAVRASVAKQTQEGVSPKNTSNIYRATNQEASKYRPQSLIDS